jgi:hypothetical protein
LAQAAPDTPPDDHSIPGDARLLRRVSQTIGVYRGEGGSRVASGAYKTRPPDEGLSVYIESELVARGLTPQDALAGLEGQFYLVAIPASLVRSLGNGIVRDPDPTDGLRGEAHALITGRRPDKVLTALASGSEHVVWED